MQRTNSILNQLSSEYDLVACLKSRQLYNDVWFEVSDMKGLDAKIDAIYDAIDYLLADNGFLEMYRGFRRGWQEPYDNLVLDVACEANGLLC